MSISKEIYIIVNLIFFGIYLISTYDFIIQIQKKLKNNKFKIYLIEITFNILQILLTIKFSQNLANGYIPSYFIIFLIIGVVIYYYTSRKIFINTIHKILNIYIVNKKRIKNFIQEMFYSKEIINLLKKELKRYTQIFKIKKDKLQK